METTTRTPFPADKPNSRSADSFPVADDPIPDEVATEVVTNDVSRPTELVFLPTDQTAYVIQRTGEIFRLDSDGLSKQPILSLSNRLLAFDPTEKFEVGLLGIELHPEFAENRRVFIRYSAPPRPGTPEDDYHHTFVLSEFRASDDGATLRAESERTVLEIPQPEAFHQSGDIVFGPDGYLYVGTGDSGQPGDGSTDHPDYVDDWYEVNWGGNGQNTTDTLLGGILRLDVDSEPTEHHRTDPQAPLMPDGEEGYAIPSDNPLVDWPSHQDEYFAWGLRNPWKTTFYRGQYFVGDVGEKNWESIYHVEAGGNYGWDVREGSHCYYIDDPPESGSDCPEATPPDVRGGEPLIDPIIEYPYGSPAPDEITGIGVIGGRFYEGSAIPGLYGRYVFGDTLANRRLFVGTPPSGDLDQQWETSLVRTDEMHPLHSFSKDGDGEIYLVTKQSIRRLIPSN